MIHSLFQKPLYAILILSVCMMAACGGETGNETETAVKDTESAMETSTQNDAPDAKLNINTASGEEFRTIPQVGDRMVHEFEEYRPYVSILQFRKEIGKYVDENQVAAYEEYIYVPIHRNDSDAETLMQVPGLDENETQQLIANRPYESNQAFFEALASFVSEEEMKTAKTYMKAE